MCMGWKKREKITGRLQAEKEKRQWRNDTSPGFRARTQPPRPNTSETRYDMGAPKPARRPDGFFMFSSRWPTLISESPYFIVSSTTTDAC